MENQGFNPIELWIKTDEKLSAILTKIEKQAVSLEKQAEMAFHQVAENYNLPKMPQDIDYDVHDDEMQSVYEILGLVNYTFPEEDPRGNVMFALCSVHDNIPFDMNELTKKAKQNGINFAEISGIGYLGDNYNVKIIFVKKNESWFDLGCKFFVKFE